MKVIPSHLIEERFARLERDLVVLRDYRDRGAAGALAVAEGQMALLESIMSLANESAEDQLTLKEAAEWSGLQTDTLQKNYHSVGEYSERRWRRGDLPLRDPFCFGARAIEEPVQASRVSNRMRTTNEAYCDEWTEEDMLDRALVESLAA